MKIRAEINGVVYEKEYSSPALISDILASCGASFSAPCGGKGVCGKCAVTVRGAHEPFSPDGRALACRTRVTGDAHIIYNTTQDKIQVLTANDSFKIVPSPALTGEGTAVDIGTTTVAAATFDLASGNMTSRAGGPNPQSSHGADVMSRLDYARVPARAQILMRDIRETVNRLIKGERAVITGNTAMMCFFAGKDASGMCAFPFAAPDLFGYEEENIYYAPCAAPFFGADAVCATAHCIEYGEPCLVADVGTNGEIACFDGRGVICCSTSAGPCFEGAGIKCGMPASDGAVCEVKRAGSRPEYTVIGGITPLGLCGTGAADLTAFLLETGRLRHDGYLESEYMLAGKVGITPADIRAIQLAKAAIRAGIEVLLDESGMRGKIKKFYLAGGLGNALKPRTAAALGLIPPDMEDMCVCAGNAALAGAARALTDGAFRAKLETLARECRYIELARDARFERYFINNMRFGG